MKLNHFSYLYFFLKMSWVSQLNLIKIEGMIAAVPSRYARVEWLNSLNHSKGLFDLFHESYSPVHYFWVKYYSHLLSVYVSSTPEFRIQDFHPFIIWLVNCVFSFLWHLISGFLFSNVTLILLVQEDVSGKLWRILTISLHKRHFRWWLKLTQLPHNDNSRDILINAVAFI